MDTENSVLIKDAVYEAVVSRLQSRIVQSKDEATTLLNLKLKKVSFLPLQYNRDGYVILYRVKVSLDIKYKIQKFETKNLISSGVYDFPIAPDSILSDIKRFDSIKFASIKALDKFISQISIESIKVTIQHNRK
jgi:hypothetical protein